MIVPDKRTIHTLTLSTYCPYLTIACIKFLCHSTLVGVCAVCQCVSVLSQVMLTVLCSIVLKAPGPSRVCYHLHLSCPVCVYVIFFSNMSVYLFCFSPSWSATSADIHSVSVCVTSLCVRERFVVKCFN